MTRHSACFSAEFEFLFSIHGNVHTNIKGEVSERIPCPTEGLLAQRLRVSVVTALRAPPRSERSEPPRGTKASREGEVGVLRLHQLNMVIRDLQGHSGGGQGEHPSADWIVIAWI